MEKILKEIEGLSPLFHDPDTLEAAILLLDNSKGELEFWVKWAEWINGKRNNTIDIINHIVVNKGNISNHI